MRQIKSDLGKFSEDPGKYIEVFQNLIQVFDLSYRDQMYIMLILHLTLSATEKQNILENKALPVLYYRRPQM